MTLKYQNKLKNIAKVSREQQPLVLGALLAKLFKEREVNLAIVGGAAVQFYTQAEFTTGDLDAILSGDTKEIIEEVMESLGFKRTSMYRHFENPIFDFIVEFPPGPIEIGSRVISDLSEIETEEGVVKIVRIEDVIMDRLVAGVEWKDEPSLDQAKLIWEKNKGVIDQSYLKKFAQEEGYSEILKGVIGSKKRINN